MTAPWSHTSRDRSCGGYGRRGPASVWKISALDGPERVVSVPPFPMGQYFKAVNLDKKEVVCPWCVGGVAKLWEWAAGNHGAIFTLLLRQSSAGGGGDFYGYSTQKIELDSTRPESVHETLLGAFGKVAGIEGQPIDPQPHSIVGRWAGDRIALVGDYDSSKIWDELPKYTNISEDLVRDWNSFIEIPERRLTFNRECSCNDEK